MAKAEHIVLESEAEVREVPDLRAARKVHARIGLRSMLRRRSLQLAIFDYYYLSIRSQSRSARLDYVLDLRFMDTPQLSRHVSWRWITASLLLTSLACGVPYFGHWAPLWPRGQWMIVYAALAGTWGVATLVAVYRTTETVKLLSTGGTAKLLEYTGGLGTLRAVRHFMTKIAAHARLAGGARRSTKAEHLRDEMREHVRLKELGVLCEPEYESAKARILGRHSPVARSSTARALRPNLRPESTGALAGDGLGRK
jgi:hypothetical protein